MFVWGVLFATVFQIPQARLWSRFGSILGSNLVPKSIKNLVPKSIRAAELEKDRADSSTALPILRVPGSCFDGVGVSGENQWVKRTMQLPSVGHEP